MKFTRDQIIEMVKDKFLNKKAIFHFDVCKALSEHKTKSMIAQESDIREIKTIKYIIKTKCKYCDTPEIG